MAMPAAGEGNPSAKLFIVGEAWGEYEERSGQPFQGRSGEELNSMLEEVGLSRSSCYVSNLVNARPPFNDISKWITAKKKDITPDMVRLRDRYVKPVVRDGLTQLLSEIALVKPNVILALGNSPLWALTGASGILKWRGSQLKTDFTDAPEWSTQIGPALKLIPTLHPAYVLRDYASRPAVINDLKRVVRELSSPDYANEPNWNFIVRPSIETVLGTLQSLLVGLDRGEREWIDFDLETRAGHIACAGLSWTLEDAICIPFMCIEDRNGYWPEDQEASILALLYRVLTHPKVKVRWQNGLYDAQYTYRHWHFVPRGAQDTMISHHTAFCGLPKSLAYQASLYCDHYVFWKDDGKTWVKDMAEDQLWRYNGIDCVRTRECGEAELRTIEDLNLQAPEAFQQKFFWPVLQCMQRGIAVDLKRRAKFAETLMWEMENRETWFRRVLGHPLNPRSSKQMCELFYNDLQQKKNWGKAKPGMPPSLTCDDSALHKIGSREPLLRPLLRKIAEYRSLGVFLSTFVNAPLDIDGRMRTSYNICGTETFRFSSSENAFGSGTNLQNIPKGGDDDESDLVLPNVREIFVPNPGYTIFDTDLSKADLRIVTWESDEPEMKAMLKEGRDPYVEIAREFYRDPTITKNRSDGSENPKYRIFKSFAHGTHYLGTPYGLAGRLGLTVYESEKTQRWYLGRFKRIALWQQEFVAALRSRRYVENIFGYRRYYMEKVDEAVCREAIAWLPQSTVALYINRIWMNLYENYPHIWVLLQVHDSLVGQFPTWRKVECLKQLHEAGQIVLPYDDPLIIPVGVKTSETSWGECG